MSSYSVDGRMPKTNTAIMILISYFYSIIRLRLAASWAEKVESRKLQFSDKQLQISDIRGNLCAQNLHLALKVSKIGIFSPKFCILDKNFCDKKISSNKQKCRWRGAVAPSAPPQPATTPLIVTAYNNGNLSNVTIIID